MKLKTLLALALLCTAAHGADKRVENMSTHCKSVMDSGLCRVALDPKDYPNATIPILLPTGVRRIDTVTYLAVRALGFQKDAQGRWLMCLDVIEACGRNAETWDAPRCVTHRSQFKQ